MEVLQSVREAQRFTLGLRFQGRTVGVVPTMGALHAGHMSLVSESRSQGPTIATIFVNPTQFAPNEDLEKYPRTLEQDFQLLREAGVEAVFVPDTSEMYPEGFSTYVQPPEVARTLEGVCRPSHFRGVATVVLKLFQAVPATHAFFGKKDFQQLRVVEAMVRDLNVGMEIVGCETLREPDGLALSSRNRYLNADERNRALLISRALQTAEDSIRDGERNVAQLESQMRQCLLATRPALSDPTQNGSGTQDPIQAANSATTGLDKIDYATIVDAETLSPLVEVDRPAVALIAGFVGQTRLIDNRELRLS